MFQAHTTDRSLQFFMLAFFVACMFAVSQPVAAKPAWKTDSSGSTESGNGGGKGKNNKTTTVTIVSAPESVEVEQGAYVAFSVVAETNDGSNISYAWYHNGQAITGATASFFSIDQASSELAGEYSVTVSARGIEDSAMATLSVTESSLPEFYPIEISLQPSSQSLYVNESVTLNVSATSAVPMQYQWRKDGQDIAGATQSYFAVNAATLGDSAQYDVVITNGSDIVVSNTAVIDVQSLPSISLNWDLPQERVDGTLLAAEEISGFSLYVKDELSQEEIKVEVAGAVTNYNVGELDRGRYYFSIATVDSAGMEGPRSDLLSFDVN